MRPRLAWGRACGARLSEVAPWTVAFVLALAVFSISLFVSAAVVIRSLQDRGAGALAAGAPFDGTASLGPDKAAGQEPQPAGTGAQKTPTTVTTPPGAGVATAVPTPDISVPAALATGPVPFVPDSRIADAILGVLGDSAEHYGVAVKRLTDGRGAVINGDRSFYAASTFKLAVLMEAERRISAGTLSLDDVIHVTDEDATEDLGTLNEVPLSADGGISVGNALHYMVTISDNSTAVALLHLFGGGEIDATLTSLGLTGTSVNTTDLPTNAADMARLMEAIYRGDGLTAAARDHALGLLLQQTIRDGVPRGVGDGVAVGNKTGTWDGNTHDIAFVDAPGGPYIIAVMSDEGGWNPVAAVSRAVYQILSKP